MKIQLVGLGNVGRSLVTLLEEKKKPLESLGVYVTVVSISDSKGTAINKKGLDLAKILSHKDSGWKDCAEYTYGYAALDSISNMKSDVVVELTPSTISGEPGLSHIRTALIRKKNVVTANKGPLVVAYDDLVKLAERNHVELLYEATVAAHLPVFCLINSCFKVDELLGLEGILNATTNFIIGEIEKGKDFQTALNLAMKAGWAEANWSDDVDGVDAARKLVILANSLFKKSQTLGDVKTKGMGNIEDMVKEARKLNKKVKLICEISKKDTELELRVAPRLISLDDPLATINGGDMGLKLTFRTSQQVFVSAQFSGPRQTAYAVLNDILKASQHARSC